MLMAALRDMQWRRRRFVIAILSTAIIFAMTLVLTGLANGFRVEAEQDRRFAGCRPVRRQGRRIRSVRRGDAVRTCGTAPSRARSRRGGGRSPRIRRRHGHARRFDAQRRHLRCAGERARHAGGLRGPPAVDPRRGRGIEHARPRDRRRGRNRFAHAAYRRHRGELHRAGQPAQRLPDHRGRPATRLRRRASGRVDRNSRHARAGSRRISRDRPQRRRRRSAAAAESGRELDHDRGDPALGRRSAGRRIGDLSVRARAAARLRGVQGDWRSHPQHRCRARDAGGHRGAARRSSSAPCCRWLLGPLFPMQVIVPGGGVRRACRSSPSSSGSSPARRDCIALFPSIPRSRSEVPEPWAISAFRTWWSSTPAARTPSARSTASTSTSPPAHW